MNKQILIDISHQPDELTCGPTCLEAIYRHYDDEYTLDEVVSGVSMLEGGGTLGVTLACHALRSGYAVRMYTYNLNLFDPSWFRMPATLIQGRLREQMLVKEQIKLQVASQAYHEFLDLGGELCFDDLSKELLIRYLGESQPILAGLSSTFLYRRSRVSPRTNEYDDIAGEPCGHFVIISGYDQDTNRFTVSDPYVPNITEDSHVYSVDSERLINSILLGVLTYDANLLIIYPRNS